MPMRPSHFLLGFALLSFGPGCSEEGDLKESGGSEDTGGGVNKDAEAPDTTVPEAEVDSTAPPMDTGTPPADTTIAPETMAETMVFVDTGFGFDTMIDTMVTDTFVLPACTTPADCPLADLECAKKTCVGGKCGVFFVPKGTATGPQTDGDCKRRECNGEGLAVIAPDPSDTPKTSTDCGMMVCVGAEPTLSPYPAGFGCSSGGGRVCNGAGMCVQCNTGSDCPGTDTSCSSRTCISNACGTSFAADGTLAGTQTAGDCRSVVCDGAGGTKTVDNTADPASDSRECTIDECKPFCFSEASFASDTVLTVSETAKAGLTTCHTPKSGTCAGGSKTCNASYGICGECDVDSDCSITKGGAPQCKEWKCSAHTCTPQNVPDNTPCALDACDPKCIAGTCTDTCTPT